MIMNVRQHDSDLRQQMRQRQQYKPGGRKRVLQRTKAFANSLKMLLRAGHNSLQESDI
jgi:hypothetical protein